ncbi:MAG: type II toxin-antitoxin system RelE/ParE family toxin [Roseiarcus sp.]
MRIVFAASFVDDADAIAGYIERQFGASRADAFIDDLNRFCELIASQPRIGRQSHGYDTTLYGVVHDVNWIFFEHDSDEVRFVHIVDGRRRKGGVEF